MHPSSLRRGLAAGAPLLAFFLLSSAARAQPGAPPPAPVEPEARPAEAAPPPPPTRTAPPAAKTEPAAAAKEEPAAEPPPAPRRTWGLEAGVGLRLQWLKSEGYQPFSSTDVMPQGSIYAGFELLRRKQLSLLVRGGYEAGGGSATLRGDPSEATLIHLTLGLEARWALGKWFFGSLRVLPAANFLDVSVDDKAAPRPMVAQKWTWGLDAIAGAGLLLGTAGGTDEAPSARFWATLDIGYSFAGLAPMNLTPRPDPSDPRQYGTLSLPALRPSGVVSSAGFAVGF